MITVPGPRRADAVGFSSLRRGNSVAVEEMHLPTLGDRLREGYDGPAVYEHLKDSIYELCDAAKEAQSKESDLGPQARDRLQFAFLHARDFLTNRPSNTPAPTVEVWDNGRVVFEWYTDPSRVVTASIDELGRLAFAAQNDGRRRTGFEFVDGQWPQELLTWIKRVKE